jgi:hypothetical protein
MIIFYSTDLIENRFVWRVNTQVRPYGFYTECINPISIGGSDG